MLFSHSCGMLVLFSDPLSEDLQHNQHRYIQNTFLKSSSTHTLIYCQIYYLPSQFLWHSSLVDFTSRKAIRTVESPNMMRLSARSKYRVHRPRHWKLLMKSSAVYPLTLHRLARKMVWKSSVECQLILQKLASRLTRKRSMNSCTIEIQTNRMH